MRNLFVLLLLFTLGYFALDYKQTSSLPVRAANETTPSEVPVEQPVAQVPAKKKSWVQERIKQRESALNRGAYDQKYNVAHGATYYYVPAATPTR